LLKSDIFGKSLVLLKKSKKTDQTIAGSFPGTAQEYPEK